jgi:hypothetical protein
MSNVFIMLARDDVEFHLHALQMMINNDGALSSWETASLFENNICVMETDISRNALNKKREPKKGIQL